MANLLPAKSRDSIIQGLHECFAVDKNVVKAILDSENWNIEKCLVGLEALSPKVIKGKMKKSNKTGQSANKAQENEAKPSNKASSSITPSKSNLKTPAKEKKKQNIQVVKQNKSKGAGDSGPSLQKNTDTKTGTKQIPSKVPEPDAELSKKKKRAALKSTYENTKLKPKVEDRISDCIKHEIKIVILMRGCPGSGKSTYAHKLLKQNGILNPEEHIFSTDNFFLDSKGNYIYCKNDLEKAHSWNQDLVEKVMKIGLSPVVVDNTHVKAWEMMCYVQFAVRLGYVLETLEPRTPWFNNESTLAKKNSHGVPKDKISSMLQNYDANLCGSDLFVKFNIAYSINQAPPQGVNYSKDSVLTAMNKAMGKRKLPIVDPSKSGNTQTSVSKNITKNTLATNSETITSLKNNKSDTISTESFEKSTSEVVTNASFPVPAIRKREIVSAIKMTSGNILRPIPLAQLSNSKEKESIKHPTVSSVNALDNIEFPSLSSNTSSSKKFDNANELAKSKIVEEKVNKITELFPHLDKEYIKKLCSDPHKELHDIVGIILLNSKIKEPEQLPEDAIDQDCESDSDIDSIEIEQIYEKDVSTLVQLFPDLSENDVKSIYRKCKYDFRSALECLLSSNCSDSDPFEFEEVYSVELPVSSPSDRSSRIEITSPDNDLKSCNISKDSSNTSERSSCKDSELSKTGGDCIINSDRNESQTDKITRLQQTDQENNIVNSSATPSSTKIIDIFNENNATCVSADIEYPTSSHFGSSADNKKVDVLSFLKPNSSEFVSSDSSNSRRFTDDSVHESLLSRNTNDFSRKSDVFNVFVNNEGKDSICPSNPVSEIRSTSSNLNSEYQNLKPKPSELINKLLDWNINDDKSTAVQCDRGVTSPKDQRDQYNPLNFLVHHTYTNTNYKDFALLKRAQNADIYPEKVLCGTFNFVGSSKPTENPVPKNKLTLDKGTSTMDVESNFNQSYDKKVVVLASMFPGVSLSDLESLLASCMGDLNWAVGLLLDSNLPVSPDFNSSELEVAPKNEGAQTEPSETVRPSDDAPLSSESPHLSKNKKTKHRIPVDGINYVMNDDSMSNHVKKIRNARLGIVETEENLSDPVDGPTTPFVVYDEWTESMEECEEEDDESLAIALSMDFVQTLQAQFGGYVPKVLPDNQVLVHLPVYLARQLHSCIMDSLTMQLEEEQKLINKMIEEDECLARQLQNMEDGIDTHLSLQDIMDEELSLSIHYSLNKKGSNENTMAGKLTKQLLSERFPTMDPVALQSILEDTDHSLYQATVLLEAAGYQRATPEDPSSVKSVVSSSHDLSREEAIEQAGAYRKAAEMFFKMRHDCFEKAQKAYLEGNKHVASYYSQMANWHNQRIEQANLLASTMLLSGNKESNTLDLHFLRVREAIQVLDLFIDAHVNNLMEMNLNNRLVYLITGRGLHSPDGKSKIRPATMARLKRRNIWYQVSNPGLLMARLTSETSLTYEN